MKRTRRVNTQYTQKIGHYAGKKHKLQKYGFTKKENENINKVLERLEGKHKAGAFSKKRVALLKARARKQGVV